MTCLFCNSINISKAAIPRPTRFNNKIFSYHQCSSCGLVFIDPVPAVEDYQVMYDPRYHQAFYFKELAKDYSYLEPWMEKSPADKKLLDYGCGDASFLQYFINKGFHCSGTEYDSELVNQLAF